MENVLKIGIYFSVLPNKLDLTQVKVDSKRHERSDIWREYWSNREQQKQETQIF